jgi:hypothetical protein
MVDIELAEVWASRTGFSEQVRRWSWFRDAAREAFQRGMTALALDGNLDAAALARGFFDWAELMEPEQRFGPLDPIDHAHFSCGALLRCLLEAQPLHCSASPHAAPEPALQPWRSWPEAALLIRLALTLLAAWRRSLQAAPLVLDPHAMTPSYVASCFENLREDTTMAGVFLDLFCGIEPAWRFPTHIHERPAMQRALAARRSTAV